MVGVEGVDVLGEGEEGGGGADGGKDAEMDGEVEGSGGVGDGGGEGENETEQGFSRYKGGVVEPFVKFDANDLHE